MKRGGFFTIIVGLLLTTCIDPFDIGDVVDGQSRLVVDGLLTNEAKAHRVRLTYSSPSLQAFDSEIGRAHVWTPVTVNNLVCRLLLEKKKKKRKKKKEKKKKKKKERQKEKQ